MPGDFNGRVLAAEAFEQGVSLRECNTRSLGQQGCHLGTEFRMGIDTGADRSAALRQRRQPFHRIAESFARMVNLRTPAIEFLPQRDGHRIHQVRATGLDDGTDFIRFFANALGKMFERRQQFVLHGNRGADVNTGRDYVVRALAHVDLVVRVHLGAGDVAREPGNDLVGIHVGTRA